MLIKNYERLDRELRRRTRVATLFQNESAPAQPLAQKKICFSGRRPLAPGFDATYSFNRSASGPPRTR